MIRLLCRKVGQTHHCSTWCWYFSKYPIFLFVFFIFHIIPVSQFQGLNQIPAWWLALLIWYGFFQQHYTKGSFLPFIFFMWEMPFRFYFTLPKYTFFFHLLFPWLDVQWDSFLVPNGGCSDRLHWLIGLCHFLDLYLLSLAFPVRAEPHWEQPTGKRSPWASDNHLVSCLVLLLTKQKQKSSCGLLASSEESNCELNISCLHCSW